MPFHDACEKLKTSSTLMKRKGGWYIVSCNVSHIQDGLSAGLDHLINKMRTTENKPYFETNVINYLICNIWFNKNKWVYSLNTLVKEYL